jgi:hypothetical protein
MFYRHVIIFEHDSTIRPPESGPLGGHKTDSQNTSLILSTGGFQGLTARKGPVERRTMLPGRLYGSQTGTSVRSYILSGKLYGNQTGSTDHEHHSARFVGSDCYGSCFTLWHLYLYLPDHDGSREPAKILGSWFTHFIQLVAYSASDFSGLLLGSLILRRVDAIEKYSPVLCRNYCNSVNQVHETEACIHCQPDIETLSPTEGHESYGSDCRMPHCAGFSIAVVTTISIRSVSGSFLPLPGGIYCLPGRCTRGKPENQAICQMNADELTATKASLGIALTAFSRHKWHWMR